MNTFIESNKGKHFTLSDRISIEAGIEKGWSFKKIADELGKSPSSVSREVRRHLIFSPHYYDDRSRRKSECIYFSSCSKQGVCGNLSCSSLCSKCRSRKCASCLFCNRINIFLWCRYSVSKVLFKTFLFFNVRTIYNIVDSRLYFCLKLRCGHSFCFCTGF